MNKLLKEKIDQLAKSQTRTEPIYNVIDGWIIGYPDIDKLADTQMHTFWAHDEPVVENDVKDLRVSCTESEKHGIITVLKLFTHYELAAGNDYWTGRFQRIFKRPEFQRIATMFGAVEMNSHAPFYNKINQVLFIDTPEFYSEYHSIPVLQSRMDTIEQIVSAKDDLVSIGGFTFIEGVILYSSFAFLKHFQEQECGAKNLITNINRGINMSVADENLHALGGAAVFQLLLKERKLSNSDLILLKEILIELAQICYEHEVAIVDDIFNQGEIAGITSDNMKDFIKHRINYCMNHLGFENIYDESKLDGFIANWFYKAISSINFHDFFSGSGSEYHINWKRAEFGKVWSNE